MSAAAKQTLADHPEPKPEQLLPPDLPAPETLPLDQPRSDPSEPEAKQNLDHHEEKEGEVEEEEEEGECGFCLFMKSGGCRESFIEWEKCVDEAEKNKEDIVEKCVNVTAALKQCMEAHSDYYEPILRAEKAAEKQALAELEKEAMEKESKEQDRASSDSDKKFDYSLEA
ncbi:uncharacterized protein LOC130969810 isoform X1 [Arachis stenosperma]|uniref:uncharacterized protein LOC130969810 isoform X1 n=1 Tax=Arachis stenosperma TaxID=217475 RepID=UPI0025AC3700|nr:uncharacterized protein LOC130969810 isoform X1 [Arachis stenosperma]